MHTSLIHELTSRFYSISRLLDITAIGSGLANFHYKLSCEHNAFYFIKIYINDDIPLIEKELSLAMALKVHGILTPAVITNKSGKLYTRHQEQTAALFEFIDGVQPEATPKNLYAAGTIIGKIHGCKTDVPLKGYTHPEELFLALKQAAPADRATAIFFQTAASISAMIPFEELPKSLIHGDLFLDNLLETASRKIYVIDFEEAALENCLFDLSRTVIGCCRKHGRIDMDLCRMLLKGYTEFRELSKIEKEYFYEYIVYTGLLSAFWRYEEFNVRRPDEGKTEIYKELMRPTAHLMEMGKSFFISSLF